MLGTLKIKIEWWRLYDISAAGTITHVYNYHIVSNNNILLSTNQGYSRSIDMFRITECLFPKAKVEQLDDRYTAKYKRTAVANH